MCISVLLVGESKEEVNAPQFMDFAVADLLDYAISSSQSHFRLVLGEDTDPKAICQWSVSTSPGLNPLDASADSGFDIGTADFWSYEWSDTLVRMSVNTSREKSDTIVRMSVNTSGEKSETQVRDNYKLDITPLDEICGVLKTHELEMEQRRKMKGSKARPVALKFEEKPKEKAWRKSYSKWKTLIAKSDTESLNSDDDSNPDTELDIDSDHNNNKDMDQMAALLVKSFKKMVYKNFKKGRSFPEKSKERCYNCDGLGHFVADCRKSRAEKKHALISKKRNWDDSSDSDDGINYALMANANVEADSAELKLPQSTLAFDTGNKSENTMLKKKNDYLQIELFSMLEIQKERDNVVYVKEKLLEKHAYLEKELAKEREVIKLWTNSRKTTQKILENGCWGSGYSARSNSDKKSGEETEKTEPIKTNS
ncbi:hypothetical protein AgCh_004103 [Apium graveolens]